MLDTIFKNILPNILSMIGTEVTLKRSPATYNPLTGASSGSPTTFTVKSSPIFDAEVKLMDGTVLTKQAIIIDPQQPSGTDVAPDIATDSIVLPDDSERTIFAKQEFRTETRVAAYQLFLN